MRPAVVIGIGNPFRHDEGVGPAVVRELREQGCPGVTLAESDGETAALIAMWDRRRLAIVVDAIHADPARPGRIHRLVVPDPRAGHRAGSTNGAGLGAAVALSRQLGRSPEWMVVYGVEAADTSFGVGLSDPVRAALPGLVAAVRRELQADVDVTDVT
ncbi:hydrogenase maturation protease [Dactylosporangium sp. NPDC005555]|uniref:hydrogenase maturation protease n=1 Tax=Dactylosporangium sp. NPDC005555 TaxID=3154889 RepID=UPI0033BC1662